LQLENGKIIDLGKPNDKELEKILDIIADHALKFLES